MTDILPIWNPGGPSGAGWSEIAAYFRCPKEYQLAKVRGVSVPRTATPDYFFIGSAFHAGRAIWLARKCAMDSETDTAIDLEVVRIRAEYEEQGLPVFGDAVTDVKRYLTEYREHYSMQSAPKTVAVEHLLGPTALTDDDTQRTARLDDIGYYQEAGGVLCIGECKTGSGTPAQIANEYQLHGQPLLQWILWELAPQGAAQYGPLGAIVLDVVQKGYSGKRCKFARPVLRPEPHALTWYKKWLALAVKATRTMKPDDDVPRNITSCARPRLGLGGTTFGSCEFRDLCTFGAPASGMYVKRGGEPLTAEDCE
jgi:hypothetical protein